MVISLTEGFKKNNVVEKEWNKAPKNGNKRKMIHIGICPNCQSKEIAGPNTLHADKSHVKIDLPGFSTGTIESYSSLNCGFTELYPDYGGFQKLCNNGKRYYKYW